MQAGATLIIDFEKCKSFNASNRELEDYFVSIDMAKEISMIQRSDKGRKARQHVIKCYGSNAFCSKLKEYRKVYREIGFTFTLLYELQSMEGGSNRAKYDYYWLIA